VDLAASVKESADFTVISTWAVTPNSDLLLIDQERSRMEGPDIVPALRATYQRLGPQHIWVEKVGFQLAIIQDALRAGLPVRDLVPSKDKLARSMSAQARMAQGRVYFPKYASWLPALEDELLRFSGDPNDRDDQVDTLSYACIVLPQNEPQIWIWRNAIR
jgi:predicted phage terminase large subunit-like protein